MAKKRGPAPVVLPWDLLGKVGMCQNRVHRVGLELEGGWSRLPDGNHADYRQEHDGSVFRDVPHPEMKIGYWSGELVSVPMIPGRLDGWVKRCYPRYVNETCGLHVHQSFATATHYARLMEPEYQATMIAELKQFGVEEGLNDAHPLWTRLAGKNRYCTSDFFPDLQAERSKSHQMEGEGNRYTIINYAWSAHKTIEVRVLPMFDTAEQSIRAIRRVLDVTSACLAVRKAAGVRPVRYHAVVRGDQDGVTDVLRERLT